MKLNDGTHVNITFDDCAIELAQGEEEKKLQYIYIDKYEVLSLIGMLLEAYTILARLEEKDRYENTYPEKPIANSS